MTSFVEHLASQMAGLKQAGTYKEELVLQSAQGPRVKVGGREVVMLTSNNYLGFANHPRIREAQKKAVDRWGAGLGSVLGGLLVGGSLLVGGTELHGDVDVRTPVSVPMLISGLAIVALGWTGYWLFWPGDEAVDQVGRDWNERHPDRLLRLSP